MILLIFFSPIFHSLQKYLKYVLLNARSDSDVREDDFTIPD